METSGSPMEDVQDEVREQLSEWVAHDMANGAVHALRTAAATLREHPGMDPIAFLEGLANEFELAAAES